MSMSDAGMKPQDTTNYLLGGMQKQLDLILLAQDNSRRDEESFRVEVRGSVRDLQSDVAVLKSKQVARTPWYAVAGGLSGIAALVLAAIALLKVLNP